MTTAALLLSLIAATQEESVARIREKAQALRPSEKDLALFRLDWTSSIEEALRRAAQEDRPVFCVVNYAQYGDAKNGHC